MRQGAQPRQPAPLDGRKGRPGRPRGSAAVTRSGSGRGATVERWPEPLRFGHAAGRSLPTLGRGSRGRAGFRGGASSSQAVARHCTRDPERYEWCDHGSDNAHAAR
jgi:hypothetical protein